MRWYSLGGIVAFALALAIGADAQQKCGPITLTASNAAGGDLFGNAVALDGDTLIVGARYADASARSQGAAFVFRRTASGWTEEARLTADDGAVGDGFGFSVAIAGDTALVGAYSDDHGEGHDQGSAYVFTRSGTVWTQQAKLTATDAASADWFGFAVALDGDTALIGALLDDGSAGSGQGSAYVFIRSDANWTEQAKLAAADAEVGAYFGIVVALDGETAIIGASKHDGAAGKNQGSVYVFTRSGSAWLQQAQLYSSDAAPNDEFGHSVALDGDSALVGAPLADGEAGIDTGSAYIFTRSGSVWTQQAILTHPGAARSDGFGASLALDGDTALLFARLDDGIAEPFAGSARIFRRTGSEWKQRGMLIAPSAVTNIVYGSGIALEGETALVGALGFSGMAGDSQGAAYVYRLNPADLNADGPTDGADLGILLGAWGQSGATDLNGDGTTDGADLSLLLGEWGPCP
jgi:hypothetical protein